MRNTFLLLTAFLCSVSALTKYEVREFADTLSGSVVLRGDRPFKKESQIWNDRRVGSKPMGVILPKTHQDVVKAMQFLNLHGLKPRVKSGGHNFAGWNQKEDGWVISTRLLDDISIDRDLERITLGAGLRFKAVYKALHRTGLLFAGGTCASVGVSGFLLGGGHSAISRKVGMGSDTIVSMEVVTADARLLTVSPTQHSDLFWALCGAGHNNFGVVVQFTTRLYRGPVDALYFGEVVYTFPGDPKLKQIMKRFTQWSLSSARSLLQARAGERGNC
jgi:FAD/FMN-containing dehydrogenase